MKVFVQDPEFYLQQLGLELSGWLDSARPAQIDSLHRSLVNYETYFFADLENKKTFDTRVSEYCGRVTDPVTQEQFNPGSGSPRLDHLDRAYYFVSDSTFNTFRAMPDMYALPNYQMTPAVSAESD